MSAYYGISTPTSDYIAHYGVKGMKWGVRKAIEKGNAKRLDRHYLRAQKKLAKLSERTDIEAQKSKAAKYNKIAKVSAGVGLTGAAIGGLSFPYANKAEAIYTKQYNNHYDKVLPEIRKSIRDLDAQNRYDTSINTGLHNAGVISDADYAQNKWKIFDDYHNGNESIRAQQAAADAAHRANYEARDRRVQAAEIARAGGLGLAALGLGTAVGSKIKAHVAKKRTTKQGHAKAVADMNAWRNQMAETFKGTKYANLPAIQKKKRRK